MREKPLLKTPVWIALIVLCALLCAALTAYFFLRKSEGSVAEVYVDGALVCSVDLSEVSEPREQIVETPYGTNVLLISKGEIRIAEADCKDELCVRQGALRAGGLPIVCLPHRLVIRMKKSDVDEVSQ